MLAGNTILRTGSRAGLTPCLLAFGADCQAAIVDDISWPLLADGISGFLRMAKAKLEMANPLQCEIVEVDGPNGLEQWLEVYFDYPVKIAGNARDGFQDLSLRTTMRFERSEDLTNWCHDWIDMGCEALDYGWRYRGRSPYPVNSAVRVSQLLLDYPGWAPGDVRDGPFINISVAGVSQPLPNYPYQMPADAAQLQADLRAAGWEDAAVSADTAIKWRISIPNVHFASYIAESRVYWPTYLVPDMWGNLTNSVTGQGFVAESTNSVGVRTCVPAQFARMRLGFCET